VTPRTVRSAASDAGVMAGAYPSVSDSPRQLSKATTGEGENNQGGDVLPKRRENPSSQPARPASRSTCGASDPFPGWFLHGISIAVWNYGGTRPAMPTPRR
jgi:hypothetical protein